MFVLGTTVVRWFQCHLFHVSSTYFMNAIMKIQMVCNCRILKSVSLVVDLVSSLTNIQDYELYLPYLKDALKPWEPRNFPLVTSLQKKWDTVEVISTLTFSSNED